MKILFVVPSQETVYGIKMPPVYPPLGVLYLGAVLEREGHAVEFLDLDIEGMDAQGLLAHIERDPPGLVGFSCVTPTAPNGFALAAAIKARFPLLPIAMGGIHPTIAPEETLAHPAVDFVAIGESEHTVRELAAFLEAGSPALADIDGLWWKEGEEVRRNRPRELEPDLDAFPLPAFHLVKDLSRYSPADAQSLPVAPIMTSRGCPGQCTYCCTKQIFGRRFRARSVQNILAEIELLVTRFGIRELHFLDDNLSTSKRRILDLCSELERRNYPLRYEISNGIRADMVDEEILRAFRAIGMVNIGFGVESGNEEILKVIRKGISKDQVRRAMAMAKDLGFETWGFFIIGLYRETPETIRDTIDFAIELDPDFAKFLILKPFPGSVIHDQLDADGLILSHDYARYGVYTAPVHHLPGLTAQDILHWQKRAYRMFYFRPSKILRHLARINSWARLRIALKGATLVFSRILARNPAPQKQAS